MLVAAAAWRLSMWLAGALVLSDARIDAVFLHVVCWVQYNYRWILRQPRVTIAAALAS